MWHSGQQNPILKPYRQTLVSGPAQVARFVNAAEDSEIIFTRGATEAINLVAYSWGLLNLKPGDEVSPWLIFE